MSASAHGVVRGRAPRGRAGDAGRVTRLALSGVLALAAAGAPPARAADDTAAIRDHVDRELPSLLATYRELHAAPELSRFEVHTAGRLAQELRALGYAVTTGIGRYFSPQFQGHGVAAVMRNGTGRTLLIRADMDALPIEERTGLPYASRVRAQNEAGVEVPVMHACGHDAHVAALIGVARFLAHERARWSGTVVLVGQPAEETLDGALAMLRDRLYERVPKPDFALALQVSGDLPAGTVGVTPGYAMAAATQMDVLVRGVGGHGSRPEQARDPVVLAANIVMQLQTIVSREVSPFDQAVVTVGTIRGGTRRNIIPDEVKLELNIRTYREEVRQQVIQSVARIARAAALGAGMPEDRLPLVTVIDTEFAPAVKNDPELTARLADAFRRVLGDGNVLDTPPVMGSEDFGQFGVAAGAPSVMFRVGSTNPERFAAARREGAPLPGTHSPLFAPYPEPTLRTAVTAMSAAALEVLGKASRTVIPAR